ncbi:hypothetical protein BLA18112_06546 [Burkholderia lata]|uniref:Uncharacterized protein n=1 Tax=Burkholderia lata (strain ATCC 17760 / DSM 23089 / LMG 22485 / NCIMB 9086 / R18194 / 383) TaxID=482957 RepID=A0A6P2ZS39_BURL3|nr:hypothetical protein BLA18112_06546 [Burkholderia lata]
MCSIGEFKLTFKQLAKLIDILGNHTERAHCELWQLTEMNPFVRQVFANR